MDKRDDHAFRHETSAEEVFILPELSAYLPSNFDNLEETEAIAAQQQAVIDRRTDRQLARGQQTRRPIGVRIDGWEV